MPLRKRHDDPDVRLAVRAESAEHTRLQNAIEPALEQSAVDGVRVVSTSIAFILLLAQHLGDFVGLGDEPLGLFRCHRSSPRRTCAPQVQWLTSERQAVKTTAC